MMRSDVYLKTLVYYKDEIDEKLKNEKDHADIELSKKADAVNVGAPGGIASLSASGTHNVAEIPFATNEEAHAGVRDDVIVTPLSLKYSSSLNQVSKKDVGSISGVCPLGPDLKINSMYLPAMPNVNVHVVQDIVERDAIMSATPGDRCIVLNDPADVNGDINGEYVASLNNMSGIDWTLLPSTTAVASVNGQIGAVDIKSIEQSRDNATSIASLSVDIASNKSDIDAAITRIVANENDHLSVSQESAILRSRIDGHDARMDASDFVVESLEPRIQYLESKVAFTPVYEFSTILDYDVRENKFTEVGRLSSEGIGGTYVMGFSMVYTLNSTSAGMYLRLSTDGGSTWIEYKNEPKDPNDVIPISHSLPVIHNGGTFDIIVEARKEDPVTKLHIHRLDITAERKK